MIRWLSNSNNRLSTIMFFQATIILVLCYSNIVQDKEIDNLKASIAQLEEVAR